MKENPKKAPRRRQNEGVEAGELPEDDEGAEIEAEEEEGEEEAHRHIALEDFLANCEAFEMAAKFCYGVKVDLNPWNVAPLRCAAEYLEMTEEFFEDNLVAWTERFIAQTVLPSIRQAVKTLKSCEGYRQVQAPLRRARQLLAAGLLVLPFRPQAALRRRRPPPQLLLRARRFHPLLPLPTRPRLHAPPLPPLGEVHPPSPPRPGRRWQ